MSDALLADLRELADDLAARERIWSRTSRGIYAEGSRDAYDAAESMVRDLIAKHVPKRCGECGLSDDDCRTRGVNCCEACRATAGCTHTEPTADERTWLAEAASELVRTSAVSYSEALETLSKLTYPAPSADGREELAPIVHHEGWPMTEGWQLTPETCGECSKAVRIADAILAAGWRRR